MEEYICLLCLLLGSLDVWRKKAYQALWQLLLRKSGSLVQKWSFSSNTFFWQLPSALYSQVH